MNCAPGGITGSFLWVNRVARSRTEPGRAGRASLFGPFGKVLRVGLEQRERAQSDDPREDGPGCRFGVEVAAELAARDLSSTANRFKAGHRLRIDISSADFTHDDRNSNRGGEPGGPVPARQTISHDPEHPSHLIAGILDP
jgi:hypothetical protein